MVQTADGWVALNSPRPSDVAALPALIGARSGSVRWPEVEQALGEMTSAEVVQTATLLGLACAEVAEREPQPEPWEIGETISVTAPRARPLVVDLTSLWAGPLAGALLAHAGCRVIKIESHARPDGARRGSQGFFRLLNDNKHLEKLHLPERSAVNELRAMLRRADVVLEASRPRVMQQWGIDPNEIVSQGTIWISITGYGRRGTAANRVAFGDDAAAAAGLVVTGDPPMFVGDALADPITGLTAATAAARLLVRQTAALVDVSLAGAAAWVRGRAGRWINRRVFKREGRWWVELSDGLVPVAKPAASRIVRHS